MFPFERKNIILNELKKGYVYIDKLANLLGVSEITIRRDLKVLEDEGAIVRLHGGAAKLVDTSCETAMDLRESLYISEKEAIGNYAASLIKAGDVVFIDSGTTTKAIFKYLQGKKDVQIVTNGFRNVEEGIKYDLPVTLIGGELKKETYAFVGPITSKVLEMYYFDKCFLGANGIDADFGLSNADPNESLIKGQAIQRSRQAYIVADHTKFAATSAFSFAKIDEVQIITKHCPEKFRKYANILVIDYI